MVPCLALRCGAVPCCAALCFLSDIQYQISCKLSCVGYRNVRVYSYLWFLYLVALSRFCSVFFSFSLQSHTYAADQNMTSPTSIQYNTGQQAYSVTQGNQISSAQAAVGTIKSLVKKQLLALSNSLVAPIHGRPFTFSCMLPCASVAGGVSRPRSGALVRILLICMWCDVHFFHGRWVSGRPGGVSGYSRAWCRSVS